MRVTRSPDCGPSDHSTGPRQGGPTTAVWSTVRRTPNLDGVPVDLHAVEARRPVRADAKVGGDASRCRLLPKPCAALTNQQPIRPSQQPTTLGRWRPTLRTPGW